MIQIEAVRQSREAGRNFSREYPEQFAVAFDRALNLPEWDHTTLNGLHLWRAPGARTKRLLCPRGKPLGWLLGEAVDASGQYLKDPVVVPTSNGETFELSEIETWIEGLAGRYAVVLADPHSPKIYQDPIGDFSVVWDPETGIAASSVLLALTRPMRWNQKFDRRGVLDGKVHFSLGHTADKTVRRMLPNHYLNLRQLKLVRHWPRESTDFTNDDDNLNAQVHAISDRLANIIRAFSVNAPSLLPISGGRDSRNLAGLLGPASQSLVAGFTTTHHKMSAIDAKIAAVIAKRLGIPYLKIPFIKATRPERLAYYRHTGYGDGGGALKVLGSHLRLPQGNLLLRGNAMELLRANQWNGATIRNNGMVRTAFGLRRLLIVRGESAAEEVTKFSMEYEKWAETLPIGARKNQLDFAFCEHLLPNTLGIWLFGYTNNFVLNPFSCRKLIHLTMQISPKLRVKDYPNKLLLERNCSHFSDIPFERELVNGAMLPED